MAEDGLATMLRGFWMMADALGVGIETLADESKMADLRITLPTGHKVRWLILFEEEDGDGTQNC